MQTRRERRHTRTPGRVGGAVVHELGISEATVRQHLSGLYRRTGCVNAAQAAYWLGSREPQERTVSFVDIGGPSGRSRA